VLIIGIDPGLTKSGWGIIETSNKNNILHFIDCGTIYSKSEQPMADRLYHFYQEFSIVFQKFQPQEISLEETFVNKNPISSLKLGHARGAIMLTSAINQIPITEYSTTAIKKATTGSGRADKLQIQKMIQMLIPKAKINTEDEADALAIALCHQHHRGLKSIIDKIKL